MAQELQVVPVTLASDIYVAMSRDATLRGQTVAEVAATSLTELYRKKVDNRSEAEKDATQDSFRKLFRSGDTKKYRTPEQLAEARRRFESHFGEVDLGYSLGSDNESIDADLAREYANNHEPR